MRCVYYAFAILFAIAYAGSAEARRVALIIGNANYRHVTPLKNPVNDARDMVNILSELGFETIDGYDLTYEQMRKLLIQFYNRAENSETALIYYSGHGIEFSGSNYFIPTDARLQKAEDVEIEAHSMTQVMMRLEDASTARIIFLDACRNNPFVEGIAKSLTRGARQVGQGLQPIRSNAGAYIAFATAPGQVAYDGDPGTRNSPFTSALKENLQAPEGDLSEIMLSVRRMVHQATRGQQVPWISSSLLNRYYFTERRKKVDLTANQTVVISGAPKDHSHGRLWEEVKRLNSIDYLSAFIDEFPNSPYANRARLLIIKIRTDEGEQLKSETMISNLGVTRNTQEKPSGDIEPLNSPLKSASELERVVIQLSRAEHATRGTEAYRDCSYCPEMIDIPTGTFDMGAAEDELGREPGEPKQRRVYIGSPFSIARFEVTVSEYRSCVADGACRDVGLPSLETISRTAQLLEKRRPVAQVSWVDAREYAAWLSKKTRKNYRLPSEAEWEYAARAGSSTRFSWGDKADGTRAHCSDCFPKQVEEYIPLAGLYPPNAFGVSDMHGNLWEWTEDCWDRDLTELRDNQWPQLTAASGANCKHRIIRGGSWANQAAKIRAAYRLASKPDQTGELIGFRVTRSDPVIDGLYKFLIDNYLSSSEISRENISEAYCSNVNYWGEKLSRSQVLRKISKYNSRWPKRWFRLRTETVRIAPQVKNGLISIVFKYDFKVSSHKRKSKNQDHGIGLAELQLKLDEKGWSICSENGRILARP